ncbi:hypothetical protein [Streptomyces luteolifulvus]|uniref:hypothetical protein n=1 Tax=Streptomyces luteolifulvus TaxID=2615112 RepID=UPI001CDA2A62|nr:hypothetical protein [Streptomyces luteolifulvus]
MQVAAEKQPLATSAITCHDLAVVKLSKIARQADVLLDLMGVAVGSLLLVIGIETYRDGGSVGWPIAGSVLFSVNLWVACRRFIRHRKPTP